MNTLLKRVLPAALLLGLVWYVVPTYFSPTPAVQVKEESSLRSGEPIRIRIPSINVDADVEHVGLTPLGAMDVPKGPAHTAWFDLGPKPGEIGSAVIDGHSGWKNNIPAVFDDLSKVRPGDAIYVEDEMGGTVTFIVRKVRTYDPNADATGIFTSHDGKAHLNLITCTGSWDNVKKSSTERLVVFADKQV